MSACGRSKKLRRCSDAAAQSAQERFELSQLLRVELERPELRVTGWSGGRLVVVVEHFGQRGELSGMHVRSAFRDTAKRWDLERALQLVSVRFQEFELRALSRTRVAPAAP